MALFYSRSHSQWRAAGICIGEGYRKGMGITCQRNYIKRVYFPDNLVAIASDSESRHLQGLLADRNMLERSNHSF